MPQGNYDHPTYLTRQIRTVIQSTTAGANGTSAPGISFPWDVNIHQAVCIVTTAGTATGHKAIVLSGTSSIGQVVLSTNTAGFVGTSGDIATKVTAGTLISAKNGTDATGTFRLDIEYNIAPDTGTWLGGE